MKFLQYCADQAVKDSSSNQDADDDNSNAKSDSIGNNNDDRGDGALAYVNEKKLNQGRALSRPQVRFIWLLSPCVLTLIYLLVCDRRFIPSFFARLGTVPK